ncbi:MAG: hypothetical protein J6X94_02415 [Lachnospiraceae bacterium]|nr:hypothetical protein [Lachnospiraceae bacterium]
MSGSEKENSDNYGYNEEAPLAPPVSEVKDTDEDELSPGLRAPYIRNNERASDYKSTGLLLTIFGGAGILFVLLTVIGIIPEYLGNPYLSYGVLFAVFTLFLVMGIISIRSAGIFEKKAKSDHTLEKRILDFVGNELDSAEVDAQAGISDSDEPEVLFFKRTDCLKKIISNKFVNIDPGFLDNLIDEELYDQIFSDKTEE